MMHTDDLGKPRPQSWTRGRAALALGGIAGGLVALHFVSDGVGHLERAMTAPSSVHVGTLAETNPPTAEIPPTPADEPLPAAARSFGWAALAGAGAVALGALAGLGGFGKTVLGAATGLARAGAAAVVAGAKGLSWLGRTGVRRALLMGVSVLALGAVGAAAGGGGIGSVLGAAIGAGGMLGVFAGVAWLRRRLAAFDAGFDALPV